MSAKVPPFFAVQWHPADISAMQALARGEASSDQQTRALDWIIKIAAGTYNVSFTPGQADATAFAEGRRFVGLQCVKLLLLNPVAFAKETPDA